MCVNCIMNFQVFDELFDNGWASIFVFFGSDGGLSLYACEYPPKGICELYKSILQLVPFTSLKEPLRVILVA